MKICRLYSLHLLVLLLPNANRPGTVAQDSDDVWSSSSKKQLDAAAGDNSGRRGQQESHHETEPSRKNTHRATVEAPELTNEAPILAGFGAELGDTTAELMETSSELPVDIFAEFVLDSFREPFQKCKEDDPSTTFYQMTQVTEPEIDNFFQTSLAASLGSGAEDDILSFFEPKTVLCVGCSKGIGRGNACHWAGRQGTERIISLATTTNLIPERCPNGGDSKITDVVYDNIKEKKGTLSAILDDMGVARVDFVLLCAGRDLPGAMRLWDKQDLVKAFRNHVAGHHGVWQEVRHYLSPDFAVVMGVGSTAAEMRNIPSHYVYHMVKQALSDLILGYAIEEAYVQPNTHYAYIHQSEAATSIGLRQILPEDVSDLCKAAYNLLGVLSNLGLSLVGFETTDLARRYHKAYAMIAGYKYLNRTNTVNGGAMIPRGAVPQTFVFETAANPIPLEAIQFNHRLLSPELVYECYAKYWDERAPNFEYATDPREQPDVC